MIGNAWENLLYGANGDDYIYGSGVDYDGEIGFTDIGKLEDGITDDPNDPNRTRPVSDDDTLVGGDGNDHLFGGDGTDTADYTTDPAGITIIWNSDGTINVRDGYGKTDVLDSIEIIRGKEGFSNVLELRGEGTLVENSSGHYTFNGHELTVVNPHY